MTKIIPSAEQQACIDFAVKQSVNLIISALAGAAKSTTLEMIANALPPKTNGMLLAFNKRIVTEMSGKLPDNIDCLTLNSLGYRAWRDKLGKRLTVNARKNYLILEQFIKSLQDQKERDIAWESMSTILNAVSFAKTGGHVPDVIAAEMKCERLMDNDKFKDSFEEILTPLEYTAALHVLTISMRQSFLGEVDFDDQLLMPTVFRAPFPAYSLVMVDEAQDLSALNHQMLAKVTRRRLIAVGDQCQAIYAFRGAHESGMSQMKKKFNMTELPLSCSYRCPEEIVKHVQWRAPHMTWWEGNKHKGVINKPKSWSVLDMPDNAAVICRNNGPLFKLAVHMLKAGRRPNLWGSDIGAALLKIMKKLGPQNMSAKQALGELSVWREANLKKTRSPGAVNDRYECIKVFLSERETLGAAITYAEELLRTEGPVNLLTAHKSKGHEFSDVYILDDQLFKDQGQDPNARYVAVTRTLENLTYVYGENCTEYLEDEEQNG